MSDTSEQIIELQNKLIFQEDTIHKLDEVIIKHSDRLDRLLRRVQELEDKVEQVTFDRDNSAGAKDEKPPHY